MCYFCNQLGLGRSPGGGHGYPLQCTRLENPMVRGAWQATVHRVAKRQTQLKRLSMRTCAARSGAGWSGGAGGAQGHHAAVHWFFHLMHWLFMQTC